MENEYKITVSTDSELLGKNHIVTNLDGLIYETAKIIKVYGSKAFGMMVDMIHCDGTVKHGFSVKLLNIE